MTKFVGLRAKTYSYLKDDCSEHKQAKGTKNCVRKRKLKFENYKNCFEAIQLENKINLLEKIKTDIVSIKKNNKGFIRRNGLVIAIAKWRRNSKDLLAKGIMFLLKSIVRLL